MAAVRNTQHQTVCIMPQKIVKFTKAKETKNTVKFDEMPEPGTPPIIGALYLQKWYAGASAAVSLTVTTN